MFGHKNVNFYDYYKEERHEAFVHKNKTYKYQDKKISGH